MNDESIDQCVAGMAANNGNLDAQFAGESAVVTFAAAPERQFLVQPSRYGVGFEVTELRAAL